MLNCERYRGEKIKYNPGRHHRRSIRLKEYDLPRKIKKINWRPQRDLNPRPADSKSDALSRLSYRGAWNFN